MAWDVKSRGVRASFVDSNVFIYVLLEDLRFGRTALNILLRFERGEEVGFTSTLVLSQVLAHLARRKSWDAIDKFMEYIETSPIVVAETTLEDFREARSIRRELGLHWGMWDDLVIVAQMRRLGIRRIYSNDSDFDLIEGIERVFS